MALLFKFFLPNTLHFSVELLKAMTFNHLYMI